MKSKLLLINGEIFDSVNKKFFHGSVMTHGDKIERVIKEHITETMLAQISEDCNIVDVGGKIISPGFIDVHSHEDMFSASVGCPVADDMARMGVTTCVAGNCGTMMQSLDEFLHHISKMPVPVNYVFYSGYNYIRNEVGVDPYGTPSEENITKIAEQINETLRKGTIGISFGLEYAPGITIEEIKKVFSKLDDKELKISIHIRDDKDASISAVEEAIEIGAAVNSPVFISHIGSMSAYGQMRKVYEIIQREREKGIQIFVDCYPYDAFATTIGSAVFDEAAIRDKKFTFDKMLFATGPFIGKYCDEQMYKESREKYPEELVVGFGMNEDEIRYAISREDTMVGSDGFVMGNNGHPRTAGTFPRFLGKYVRQEEIMTLEKALYKITLQVAEAVGIHQKGVIEKGKDADLVVFDPKVIIDQASYTDVNKPPLGIEMVIVNGQVAVEKGNIIARNGNFIPKDKL